MTKPNSHVMSNLFDKEKNIMISRAISSAEKHGIKLKHGTPNPGLGDCAFEAVIQNINDRKCFPENFLLPIQHYRRLWVTDMCNRTVNTEWNIYSEKQWREGWNEMLKPGTYERDIFGDLMIPGIACAVRKLILIFNTNTNSPHSPIFVINPSKFNVEPNTRIPVVLAYNLSHYESLHPCNGVDIERTVNLAEEYMEGSYRYKREDLSYLLGLGNKGPSEMNNEHTGIEAQRKFCK